MFSDIGKLNQLDLGNWNSREKFRDLCLEGPHQKITNSYYTLGLGIFNNYFSYSTFEYGGNNDLRVKPLEADLYGNFNHAFGHGIHLYSGFCQFLPWFLENCLVDEKNKICHEKCSSLPILQVGSSFGYLLEGLMKGSNLMDRLYSLRYENLELSEEEFNEAVRTFNSLKKVKDSFIDVSYKYLEKILRGEPITLDCDVENLKEVIQKTYDLGHFFSDYFNEESPLMVFEECVRFQKTSEDLFNILSCINP